MMLGLGSLIPDMAWGEGQDELLGGPAFGDIVRAVEWQESRGRDDAVSPKGAYGAMQLMPGAVVDYARAHGLPTDPQTIETLRRDPKRNREIGAWYLQQVQDQFGGEMVPALAAYNAGPGRVKRVLAGFGGKYSPEIEADFIAQLPAETRDYIAKIKGRLNTANPSQEAAPMPQPEYDVDQSLANMTRMSERVGQMQPAGVSAIQPRPQAQGLSALSPYLEIAQQLMPQRQGRPWADALINAGAAMMQSNRPDFLGGVGAGLQAANQSMARDEEQRYRDQVGTLDLGMKLAQMGQRDDKPVVLGEGGTLVDPRTGRQIAGNPKVHEPKYEQVMEGDEIVTYEKVWNGAMMKRREVARAPRAVSDRTLVQIYDPASPTGTRLVPREQASGQAAPLPPGWSVEVGKDGQVKIVQGAMGGRPTQTDPVTGLSNEVLKELDKNLVSAQGQAMQVNRFAQQFKPIYQTIPERGRMWGTALQERMGMDPGPDAKASLAEFTRFKAEASQFFADRLKEMSGGAVTDGEAARQMAYLPTPGTGLFDGDSPSEFSAKTERLQGFFDAAAARLAYIRKAGIGISSMAELESKVPLEQVPKLIRSAIDVAKSDLAKDYPNASPETLESYAIRRVARDFGLMDNSPLLAAAAPRQTPPPPAPRELPPSDADLRRQQQQQAPAQPQSGGGIIPSPKRFELGGPKVGGAGLPAPDAIRTMDRSALEALFPRVSEMTNEQLMALQARRRQLLGIDPAPGGTP